MNYLQKRTIETCEPSHSLNHHSVDQTSDGSYTTRLTTDGESTNVDDGFLGKRICRLLKNCGSPPIHVVLPNGKHVVADDSASPIGTITIRDYKTVLLLAYDPFYQFAQAYTDGRIEIEGDFSEVISAIFRGMNGKGSTSFLESFLMKIRRPRPNTFRRSRRNIGHHYDLGNDFYKLWLDSNMLYTCAYYARADYSLEQAQLAKLEHVCRKLQLRPGMRVVEAGCGWGGLAMYMAEKYRVSVDAFNISKQQIDYAREQARQRGLQDRVRFIQDDWRNIHGQYDRFASVGMLEHVGAKNYRRLGRTIIGCLKREGIGLVHSIGQKSPQPLNPWIERNIFPGAYTPTLSDMMQIFEPVGCSVLDVENLRLHYAMTLRHWLERFESSVSDVQLQFDENFIRMWRMYLAGSIAAFENDYLQLFQVTFASPGFNNVPKTREHLYSLVEPDKRTSGDAADNGFHARRPLFEERMNDANS